MHNGNRLGLGRLAAFSSPVVLFQAIELSWRVYLPSYLTQIVGLSLATVGTLLLVARLLDAFADPFLGWLSDHVRTPFGQRKPWMTLGAPLVSAGALALFLAPTGTSVAAIVIASLALHLGYSLIVTPHGGWGLELASDAHERTRLMGAKVWFGSAGSIVVLLAIAVTERHFGVNKAVLVAALGVVIAILAPVSVGLVIGLFQERARQPDARIDGPLRLFSTLLRDRDLVRIFGLYVLTGIADASSMGTFLFLVENVMKLEGWGASLMLAQPALVLITLPIWSEVSRRIGREKALMVAYAWQALTMPLFLLLPSGGLLPLAGLLLVRNLSWGVDYMLLRAMVADIVDRDLISGTSRAASCYGLTSITLKLAMGTGAAGALWLIAMSGFNASAMASPSAALTIKLVYAVPTALAGLIGLIVLMLRRKATQTPSPTAAAILDQQLTHA